MFGVKVGFCSFILLCHPADLVSKLIYFFNIWYAFFWSVVRYLAWWTEMNPGVLSHFMNWKGWYTCTACSKIAACYTGCYQLVDAVVCCCIHFTLIDICWSKEADLQHIVISCYLGYLDGNYFLVAVYTSGCWVQRITSEHNIGILASARTHVFQSNFSFFMVIYIACIAVSNVTFY